MASYSSLSRFSHCDKAWLLDREYREEQPVMKHFVFGSAVHAGLQGHYLEGLDMLEKAGFSEELAMYDDLVERGQALMEKHKIEILHNELNFKVEFDSTPEPYIGFVDGLCKMDGKYYLLEFKTAKDIKTEHLVFDGQTSGYMYAWDVCETMKDEDGVEVKTADYPIEGVIWIALKKQESKPIKLKKDGTPASNQSQAVCVEEYRAKLKECYLDNGDKIPEANTKNLLKIVAMQKKSPAVQMVVINKASRERYISIVADNILTACEEMGRLREEYDYGGVEHAYHHCSSIGNTFYRKCTECEYSEKCLDIMFKK